MSNVPVDIMPAAPEKKNDPAINEVQLGESNNHDAEPLPELHAKTFLAVFAVCLIYFAQDFALIGAGAVSSDPLNCTMVVK